MRPGPGSRRVGQGPSRRPAGDSSRSACSARTNPSAGSARSRRPGPARGRRAARRAAAGASSLPAPRVPPPRRSRLPSLPPTCRARIVPGSGRCAQGPPAQRRPTATSCGRTPDTDLAEAGAQVLAALLELGVALGKRHEPVDGRLQLGHGLGIVGILVRVGEVGQAQVGEPEALDDLHDLGPPVRLAVDIAALPADGRPPVVEQDMRVLRLGLAVAVHLVDHDMAAGPEHAQHLGKDRDAGRRSDGASSRHRPCRTSRPRRRGDARPSRRSGRRRDRPGPPRRPSRAPGSRRCRRSRRGRGGRRGGTGRTNRRRSPRRGRGRRRGRRGPPSGRSRSSPVQPGRAWTGCRAEPPGPYHRWWTSGLTRSS